MGHGEKLTRKHEDAITALLAQPTICDAAKQVGVGEATLRRWLKLDGFIAAYRAARQQVVENAIAQLQAASGQAEETLVACLGADGDSIRLRAAVAILEQSNNGMELLDLETRLAALEAAQSQATNGRVKTWR